MLEAATESQLLELASDFHGTGTPAQLPPPGDWLIWLFLGGRGAGKTRAGAEWVRAQVKAGVRRIALVGPTFNDVREVMIDGPSGLARIGLESERPRYEVSRKRLIWPNGAEGYAFSAEDPDGLRGPQFEIGWGDEFAAWAEPQKTLDTLRMGLRLGDKPRLVLSTTPRPIPALKALMKAEGVVATHQPTSSNAANLAPGFLAAMQAAYGGSVLGRQEIEGLLIDDPAGALWRRADIEAAIVVAAPELDRIIVAVDPPATGGPRSDECGIVVAGAAGEGASRRAYVLADRSFGPAMPADWARVVAESFEAFAADGLVAEANQGGEMVRSVLQAASSGLPVRLVHASRGKHVRAEPVAALYAAGRVFHTGHFAALEDQMCAFGAPGGGPGSPDRVDALVWAVTDLLLETRAGPRLRRL
ncbi:terminase family protein [uncultured Maricaulis sp.]|uniref:DNA-packaging protein n=1 Tax=uncultured Maricaulis sp. TaxID=174710 RepID=UPI0030D829B1|tara:strand:+ start:124948 stop:126198 length:1251 start_codon:yes stop_codon:yes gene_type:complete